MFLSVINVYLARFLAGSVLHKIGKDMECGFPAALTPHYILSNPNSMLPLLLQQNL